MGPGPGKIEVSVNILVLEFVGPTISDQHPFCVLNNLTDILSK